MNNVFSASNLKLRSPDERLRAWTRGTRHTREPENSTDSRRNEIRSSIYAGAHDLATSTVNVREWNMNADHPRYGSRSKICKTPRHCVVAVGHKFIAFKLLLILNLILTLDLSAAAERLL